MSLQSDLRDRARTFIPNGMYGHESVAMLPEGTPQFWDRAEGARLWDVEGREYVDMISAYGPNLFGYGEASVQEAFLARLRRGDCMTGPGPVMVDLAEAMVNQVSHAAWAMFCKNGSDATMIAMMTARNHTKRPTILVAEGAYHGSTPVFTPLPNGVTEADRVHRIDYRYNDVESLEAAVRAAGDGLAGIFATPFRHEVFDDQALPDPAYARRARELCDETGALLIVDDVRAGFRLARDCSWSVIGVQPDLSCWGKCLANGHAISAVCGSEKARAAAGSIYVTGSFWFAAAPMAAGLATLKLIRETDYLERMQALGDRLRAGLDEAAARHGFGLRQTGPSVMPMVRFEDDEGYGKGYAFCEGLLARGALFHPWHNMFVNAAMTEADIDLVLEAADGSLAAMKGRTLAPVEKLQAMRALRAMRPIPARAPAQPPALADA